MQFSQGHALLIGVGTYMHAPQLDVPAAAADARGLAQVLGDDRLCAYPRQQVVQLSGRAATRATILHELAALASRCPPDGTAIVFYCGHGAFSADGAYHLATADTQVENGYVVAGSALSQAELLTHLRGLRAARTLLIFNACHAGALSPTLDLPDAPPITTASLPEDTRAALLAAGKGCAIVTACRTEQRSYIGAGRFTLFTQALIAALLGKGVVSRAGYVSAFDLYAHVFQVVSETVHDHYGAVQEPELTVLQGVGPFPVALYRGSTTLGVFPNAEPLPPGNVQTVSEEASQAAYHRLVAVHGGIGVGGDMVDSTAVSLGREASIAAPVDIGAPVSGSVVVGVNIGGTIANRVENPVPAAWPAGTIAAACAEARRAAERARAEAQLDRADDLAAVAATLDLAEKAKRAGRVERRDAKVAEAHAAVTQLAATGPGLEALLAMLARLLTARA